MYQICHFMPERRGSGEGDNSEVWSTNPYRGISHCQGIYKRIRIAHTILMEFLTRLYQKWPSVNTEQSSNFDGLSFRTRFGKHVCKLYNYFFTLSFERGVTQKVCAKNLKTPFRMQFYIFPLLPYERHFFNGREKEKQPWKL